MGEALVGRAQECHSLGSRGRGESSEGTCLLGRRGQGEENGVGACSLGSRSHEEESSRGACSLGSRALREENGGGVCSRARQERHKTIKQHFYDSVSILKSLGPYTDGRCIKFISCFSVYFASVTSMYIRILCYSLCSGKTQTLSTLDQ